MEQKFSYAGVEVANVVEGTRLGVPGEASTYERDAFHWYAGRASKVER